MKTPRQKFDISEEQAGRRLDNYLFSILKNIPKSLIYRLLRKRAIRVNGQRKKQDYRLQADDQVSVPELDQPPAPRPYQPSSSRLEQLKQAVLFEDNRFLVLNKPSGMPVHGGTGLKGGVIEALRILRPDCHYLELAHRLDRETSGCLLIAKRPSVLRQLHELLRTGKVTKLYTALTQGDWGQSSTVVKAHLLKNRLQSGERMVKVNADGKAAHTVFHLLKLISGASLVRVELHTGRTHQIRVHAAHKGHPLAGDAKYGDKHFNKLLRAHGLKRLFLHASRLMFTLPATEQTIDIEVPLPADLIQFLQRWEKEHEKL